MTFEAAVEPIDRCPGARLRPIAPNRRATLRAMPVEIDIEHVARLARIELSDEERKRLLGQLTVILEAAAKVGEVATDDVPPTSYAIPRSNVLRSDEVEPSLPYEEALANAPDREGERFRVPRVAEIE
jgi:aspartyl-tRNA(Asn)/glutamyl-tRNA(Gln) amidotransferase subunit C